MPKLLVFSDLHADPLAARRLVEQSRTAEVVIGAGDFGNVRRQLQAGLEGLRAIHCPLIMVAGNNESTEELRSACRDWSSAYVLHGTAVTINNLVFYGVGGGIPITPFGAWSYDFSEAQATRLLEHCPAGCVLVTHSPPYGVVDADSSGRHLGSRAIHDAIVRVRSRLVVCGHIHASAGQQALLGPTPVVNAGPDGVEWLLPE